MAYISQSTFPVVIGPITIRLSSRSGHWIPITSRGCLFWNVVQLQQPKPNAHQLLKRMMVCEKYSVLLPTYNERENLPYIIFFIDEAFAAAKANYEVIIIDDASPDGTQEVAKALQEHFGSHIILAPRQGKLGLGSAYSYGFRLASGTHILILDADLSHHPRYIPEFIRMQQETNCDVVTGTRYVKDGGVHGWSLRRMLVSRVANYLAQVLLRPGVSDLTGSFRLYSRDAFRRIMREMKSTGYVFQMEIVVRARRMNMDVQEVPITFVDRLFGSSKMGTDEIAQYLKQIWDLMWVKPEEQSLEDDVPDVDSQLSHVHE